MKKLFIAAMALATIVSCSKDEGDQILESSKKSVTIKIENIASATRAAGGETLAADANDATNKLAAATDKDLVFLFADNGGKVVESRTLNDKGDNATLLTKNGTGDYTFHKLPENVTMIGVIANATSVPATLADAVKAWTDESNQLALEYNKVVAYGSPVVDGQPTALNAKGGVTLTRVAGQEATAPTEHEDAYPLYTASVRVAPYMARIEVTRVACTDLGQTDNDGFEKITINKLSLAGGNYKTNATADAITGTKVTADANGIKYTCAVGDDDNNVLDAHYVVASDSGDKAVAATSKVWSWNILPQAISNLTVDMLVEGNGYLIPAENANKTVTVVSYANAAGNITEFKSENIYRFAIDFSESNVDAGDAYICVNVTVQIANWVINETTVGFQTNPNN